MDIEGSQPAVPRPRSGERHGTYFPFYFVLFETLSI